MGGNVYDGMKRVVGVLRVCIFSCGMVRIVEELRWYLLRFFFTLHVEFCRRIWEWS